MRGQLVCLTNIVAITHSPTRTGSERHPLGTLMFDKDRRVPQPVSHARSVLPVQLWRRWTLQLEPKFFAGCLERLSAIPDLL